MKKTLLLALLIVALVAAPAFASVQNVKISGDINSTWLVRDQFDLGQIGIANDFYQNLLITQTRLRVDADLTDNVSATVALLNERVWGEFRQDTGTDGDTDVQLNLAYVTLREMLYSPLTVVIGRQSFAFGNSFVIDSGGTNNSTGTGGLNSVAEDLTLNTAQDAVRMTLDYNPLTIDIIASKIDENNALGTGAQDDDVDLFGFNTNYQLGDDMETVVEAYFWAKIDQNAKDASAVGPKADTVYMPGVRASSNVLKGLNVQGEIAMQFGNKDQQGGTTPTSSGDTNVPRRALGAQVIANYMLPFEQTAQYSPVVTTVYTYVSGDTGPSAGKNRNAGEYYTAWDPMFENQGGGSIYNTLFNLTNTHIVTIRAEAKPMEDVTASIEWNGMWLDKKLNDNPEGSNQGDCTGADCLTLLQPDGSSSAALIATSNKKIGDEIGIAVLYDYTEDVQFGARMDWFIPGNLFTDKGVSGLVNQPDAEIASQVMVNGSVAF